MSGDSGVALRYEKASSRTSASNVGCDSTIMELFVSNLKHFSARYASVELAFSSSGTKAGQNRISYVDHEANLVYFLVLFSGGITS